MGEVDDRGAVRGTENVDCGILDARCESRDVGIWESVNSNWLLVISAWLLEGTDTKLLDHSVQGIPNTRITHRQIDV